MTDKEEPDRRGVTVTPAEDAALRDAALALGRWCVDNLPGELLIDAAPLINNLNAAMVDPNEPSVLSKAMVKLRAKRDRERGEG